METAIVVRTEPKESQLSQLPLMVTRDIKYGKRWIIISTYTVRLAEHVSSLSEVCEGL